MKCLALFLVVEGEGPRMKPLDEAISHPCGLVGLLFHLSSICQASAMVGLRMPPAPATIGLEVSGAYGKEQEACGVQDGT